MKKLINYLIAIVLTLPILSGCEDFLDTQSYTTKDSSTYPKTEKDANEVLTGVYGALARSLGGGGGRTVESSYIYVGELASDERFGGGGINDRTFQGLGHMMYNNTDLFNDCWNERYTGIARANGAIESLETTMPEGKLKDQKIGEAKFIRALLYFELVQLLGDVPLMKGAPENVTQAKVPPGEAPQEDIYKFIATDLWEAYNMMPSDVWDTYPSGTITRWAAASLLSRVYLFYTGFYQKPSLPLENGEQIESAEVLEALKDVIDNSGHSLVPDYRQLWDYTNKATKKDYPYAKDLPEMVKDGENPEHVFVIKCSPAGSSSRNSYSLYFALRDGTRSGIGGFKHVFPLGYGWGSGPVNPKLWEDWVIDEPNDLRRVASIYKVFIGDNPELTNEANPEEGMPAPYTWGLNRQMEETGLWQKKYITTRAYGKNGDPTALYWSWTAAPSANGGYDFSGDSNTNGSGKDIIYIRYADVLLMHSELSMTADGINQVRARVDLPAVSYTLENLQKERRYELCFEGVRWGDIRRWHIAEQVLANKYGAIINNNTLFTTQKPQSPGGIVERYRQTNGFFWKPQTQIDLGNGKIKQNDGWGPEALYTQWQ
jgi:starch-binding outer membrane protein, SusD/RagB family